MKKIAPLMALALAAAVATPALSQTKRTPLATSFASDTSIVPVMVNAGGLQGATFGTYVAIMNPTSSSFPVHVTLWDNEGISYRKTIPLAAGELKSYENFLASAFNFSGAGAVVFQSGTAVGGSSDNLFILSAEVYTTASGVRYGTSVPSADFPGTDSRSFSTGITIDSHNRTNVGCFNESGAVNHVAAKVFDGSGHEMSTLTIELAPHAWRQAAVQANVSGGYIQFDPAAAAACYAVVVNNTTNDGRFVPAVEYTP